MIEKFNRAARELYDEPSANSIIDLFTKGDSLDEMPVNQFMETLVRKPAPIDTMIA